MVGMRMESFGGMLPLVSRRLLPDGMATFASNAYLRGGEVRGIREPKLIKSYPAAPVYAKAIRIPDPAAPTVPVWFPLVSRLADFHPNPLVNDAFNRFIWLDNNGVGNPDKLYENSLARIKLGNPPIELGVPPPAAAMGLSVVGGAAPVITRAYVYTYVNIFGEEGQPSPPVEVSGNQSGSWNLTGIVNPAFAAVRGIDRVRIYRTITGNSGTTYYRVVEQAVGLATYNDTVPDSIVAQAANIMLSTSWRVPEEMEGFVAMANGIFAGWRGKDVFFSEAYRPWAWPAEYIVSVDYQILDCGVVDQTLVVLTESTPSFITGVDPSQMSISKAVLNEPCVEPLSIVQAPEGVYYASANGLMLASSVGMTMVTKDVINRDDWQRLHVPKIRSAVSFDSQYIALGENGTGFVVDPRGLQGGLIDILNFPEVGSIWTDVYTAEAHLMIDNQVYTWSDTSAPFSVAEWVSKVFQFRKPVNLGAIKVAIDPAYATGIPFEEIIQQEVIPPGSPWPHLTDIIGYNLINGCEIHGVPAWGSLPPGAPAGAHPWPYWYGVEPNRDNVDLPPGDVCMITVFADDAVVWRSFVQSDVPYRLPSGFKSDTWQIQVKTRVPVLNIQLAETMKELANV